MNVRSQAFYLARTTAACGYCRSMTRLLALAVPPGHQTLDAQPSPEAWQRADNYAFLFYVEHLPWQVQGCLNRLLPFFRLAYSSATLNSYWANHCEHCGALLGDHDLHCEPDGAFMPGNEAEASAIELLEIRAPFEASAAGYACEPEFLSSMCKA